MSLLWRVFLANVLVLLVALALLTFSPIEVDYPIKFGQFLLLFVGFVVLVTMNLRAAAASARAAPPPHRGDDHDRPGHARARGSSPRIRAAPRAGRSRTPSTACSTGSRALAARRPGPRWRRRSRERLRVAQELHDEIGQTLTAVTIQAERAAEGDPAEAPQALRDVANSVRDSLDEVRRIARELRPEALDDLGLVNALIALCNRHGRPGRAAHRARPAGHAPADAARGGAGRCTGSPRRASRTRSGTPTRARSASGSQGDAESVALRVRDDGDGMPRELPEGTSGHRGHARAGDPRGRPLLDRVDSPARHRGAA